MNQNDVLREPLTDGCGDVDRKGREKEVSGDPVGFGRDPAKTGVILAGVGRNG